jgi:hypothetical protein
MDGAVVFGEGASWSSGLRKAFKVRLADGTERRVQRGKNYSTYITLAGKRVNVYFNDFEAAKGEVACELEGMGE